MSGIPTETVSAVRSLLYDCSEAPDVSSAARIVVAALRDAEQQVFVSTSAKEGPSEASSVNGDHHSRCEIFASAVLLRALLASPSIQSQAGKTEAAQEEVGAVAGVEWAPLPLSSVDEREILLEIFAYDGMVFASLMIQVLRRCIDRYIVKQCADARVLHWWKSICEFAARLARNFVQHDGCVQLAEHDLTADSEKEETEEDTTAVGKAASARAARRSSVSPFWLAATHYTFVHRQLLPLADELASVLRRSAATAESSDSSNAASEHLQRTKQFIYFALSVMESVLEAPQYDARLAQSLLESAANHQQRSKRMRRQTPAVNLTEPPYAYASPVFVPPNANCTDDWMGSVQGILCCRVMEAAHHAMGLSERCNWHLHDSRPVDPGNVSCGLGDANAVLWLLLNHNEVILWNRRCGVRLHSITDDACNETDSDSQEDEEQVAATGSAEPSDTSSREREIARKGHRAMIKAQMKKAAREQSLMWSSDECDNESSQGGGGGDSELIASNDPDSKSVLEFPPIGVFAFFEALMRRSSQMRGMASLLSVNFVSDYMFRYYCRSAIASDSLCCKTVALRFILEMCQRMPRYGGRIDHEAVNGSGGISTDSNVSDDTPHLLYTTSRFKQLFALAQDLVHTMATCPSSQHRAYALNVLVTFFESFAEGPRLKLQKALIELSPYSSVASLLLHQLKDDILQDFAALSASKSATICQSVVQDATSQPHQQQRRPELQQCRAFADNPSAFFKSIVLSEQTVQFLCSVSLKWSSIIELYGEALASALNVIRTVVFSDARFAEQLGSFWKVVQPDCPPGKHHGLLFAFEIGKNKILPVTRLSESSPAERNSYHMTKFVRSMLQKRIEKRKRMGIAATGGGAADAVAFSIDMALDALEQCIAT